MTRSTGDTKANNRASKKKYVEDANLDIMKKGYKEMANINLSISKLCFEVESEALYYYDRVAESE